MLAIIGGSGLYSLGDDFVLERQAVEVTPYGETSAVIQRGRWRDLPLLFLPRHGPAHKIPPHRVNYRANLWALKQFAVQQIIAVNAVGGIAEDLPPQTLAFPDQIIDYSSGREHSYFDGGDGQLNHIEFATPYSESMRAILIQAGRDLGLTLVDSGTYGCTNGPRLETAAEIMRLRRDGCTMVGMTGMPEAALARELEMEYACLALVVNWAAGIRDQAIGMPEILMNLEQGMQSVKSLLLNASAQLQQ